MMPRKLRALLAAAFAGSLVVALAEATALPPRHAGTAIRGPLSQYVPDVYVAPPAPLPPPVLATVTLTGLQGSDPITIAPFDAEGRPRPAALEAVRQRFKSRAGAEASIDPRLIGLLMRISAELDHKPITIVSGHRAPGRGTSKTSYHVRGMAADIAVPGVTSRELHKVVMNLGEARGLGLYPHFVHVDVRDDAPYRWGGGRWGRRR